MHPTIISALAADNQRRMLDRAAAERLSHEARRVRRSRLRSLFAAACPPDPRRVRSNDVTASAPSRG